MTDLSEAWEGAEMLFCVNQVGDEPGSFGDVGGRYVHLVEGESRGIMQRSGSIVL